MLRNQLILRRSPIVFLKRLVIIEFFFALLPFVGVFLFYLLGQDLSESYRILPFSGSIPFEFFMALAATSLQVLIVAAAFTTWYFPVYVVNRDHVIHERGNLRGNQRLLNTPSINYIEVKQGPLGRSFNYGSIQITASDSLSNAILKDIPEPFDHVSLIEEMAAHNPLQQQDPQPQTAVQLVNGGEHQHVEYKSSLVWDYHQQRANKALHQPVMKTLVALMNSSGGYLLIGVADDGQILGLDPDLQTLRSPTLDAFETAFNMAFNKMIGVEYRQFVDVAFPELDQKPICILRVQPSTDPVFLFEKGSEKFYIRAGNASQSLTISQANRYIQRRFPEQL